MNVYDAIIHLKYTSYTLDPINISYHHQSMSNHYRNAALNTLQPWYIGRKPWHNKTFNNIRVSTKDIMDGFPFLFKNHRTGYKAILCLVEKSGSSAWKSLLIKHLDPMCFQQVHIYIYIYIIYIYINIHSCIYKYIEYYGLIIFL